jgi:hypothetical protein
MADMPEPTIAIFRNDFSRVCSLCLIQDPILVLCISSGLNLSHTGNNCNLQCCSSILNGGWCLQHYRDSQMSQDNYVIDTLTWESERQRNPRKTLSQLTWEEYVVASMNK